MRSRTSKEVDATALTSTDPATALRGVRALRKLVETLEAVHVRHARSVGWSWQDIADALGVTRQTVHKKHAGGE